MLFDDFDIMILKIKKIITKFILIYFQIKNYFKKYFISESQMKLLA
jgi:hypothetical protein